MLELDPELRPIFERMFAARPKLPRGDWQGRRKLQEAGEDLFDKMLPATENIQTKDFHVVVEDGTSILLRWYEPIGSTSKTAMLYTHGGGKFLCSVDMYDALCKLYAARADVGVLAVDFRLPPEHPYPVPIEDCYSGLVWLAENAEELGVDPNRIVVAGDSGGGGIAPGVALMARDRKGPKIAKQLLLCPMLDDRTTVEDPALTPFMTWTYDDNYTGWQCLVGDAIGSADVSPYAAPSRENDLSGLPPTFIDVGELDIFRDESVDYATRLSKAGVSVELHIYPGAPHGWEIFGFNTSMATNAWQARFRAISVLNT